MIIREFLKFLIVSFFVAILAILIFATNNNE
jgi:hypothetical protein